MVVFHSYVFLVSPQSLEKKSIQFDFRIHIVSNGLKLSTTNYSGGTFFPAFESQVLLAIFAEQNEVQRNRVLGITAPGTQDGKPGELGGAWFREAMKRIHMVFNQNQVMI